MGLAKLLKPSEAAEYLQVSEKTLEDWRRTDTGPAFQRMGRRCVRYFQSDIDRWLKDCTEAAEKITERRRPRLGIVAAARAD